MRQKKEITNWFSVFLVIFVMLGLPIFTYFHTLNKQNNVLQDYCNDKGYKELTDRNTYCYSYGSWLVKVECDNIYAGEVGLYGTCIEYDKWGTCVDNSGIAITLNVGYC